MNCAVSDLLGRHNSRVFVPPNDDVSDCGRLFRIDKNAVPGAIRSTEQLSSRFINLESKALGQAS